MTYVMLLIDEQNKIKKIISLDHEPNIKDYPELDAQAMVVLTIDDVAAINDAAYHGQLV